MAEPLRLGADPLTIADLVAIARGARPVALDADARGRVARVREGIDALLAHDAPNTYGVNTGFGALAEVRIDRAKLAALQVNLVRSHATGVGARFDRATTRAMMLLRANVLMLGTSGVRPAVPELLVEMLRRGVHPCIPEQGSVGASGDLAPLAHLALVLIGEGQAEVDGRVMPGGEALAAVGLKPVTLAAKEGLALINGTQAMTADCALTIDRAQNLARVADITGAASAQALLGSRRPFDARIHAARPHPGQLACAENLRHLTADSEIIDSHRQCKKVQDPYSLRCMPQVHGATRDVIAHAADVIGRELNAATDNPLVFTEDDDLVLISGGNFHGQPIALAADYLGIGLAELANISERRIEQLVNPSLSSGLPPFLAGDSGLNSGFMIAQVTAASLVSENKVLAHPASVDSIPSSANREDHVSMGTLAARKARRIAEHVETVLAIELLCAAQGMHLRRPLTANRGIEAALRCLRAEVPPLDEDRVLHPDIAAAAELIRSGRLVAAVEAEIGPLV
ncbi:MAG: histidine ammonia-lyase [Myxococcales bacterium]|nr:histidine ammonia-lyase [Myxococcales bacterium]